MQKQVAYTLRLYIDGRGSNSAAAQTSAQRICRLMEEGEYVFETVDVIKDTPTAGADRPIIVPALLVTINGRRRIFYGQLAHTEKICREIKAMRNE